MNLKPFLIGAALALPVGLFGPGGGTPFPIAKDAGTKTAVLKAGAQVLAADQGRHGWCIENEAGNSDNIRFTLGNTASTTVGFNLGVGAGFCDPIGDAPVYTGAVYVAAVTTSATVNISTLAY